MNRQKSKKIRADSRLLELGLAETKSKAQALILAGKVFLDDRRIDKPGTSVAESANLHVKARQKYVSRGGLKLEGALENLHFNPHELVCVDIGASTGGFTDCLLQKGARKVYAVDVGQGLLANKLVQDDRVVVMDKTNARHLTQAHFQEPLELAVVDASFIGIAKLLPALAEVLPTGSHLIAMIKPQFEVGKEDARKNRGVIKDPELRQKVIEQASASVVSHGFEIVGQCDSSVPGPKGNVEHFIAAKRITAATANSTSKE